ncbi:DUF2884 family protein [Dyella sp. C9]|uniref:DUF2884 family protein n=1 Tax=Dyella sp. C9 TaxID=2202154 RepID=UPI000DEFEF12|nr:DUF2884 family protein [Dyella sp. C9]
MRSLWMAAALAAGLASATMVRAGDLDLHGGDCHYSTDFDVRVVPAGVGFHRDHGVPADVFMHNGQLRVDGREVVVSAADAERLRAYEQQVRDVLPEVAGIAREGVNIGYAAIRTVLLTFADNDSERHDMVDRLDRHHRDALARIDDGLGRGEWHPHDLDDVVGQGVEDAVSDVVGKVAGAAVTAALSGDQAKVAALQARADSLDQNINKEVNTRAKALDRRADALCPRLDSLAQLQQQFGFRLSDGSRLQLMTYGKDNNKKLTTASTGTRAD